MASWEEFAAAAPELAGRVRAAFDVRKHKTLATLRKDGAPRISGIETEFVDGELVLGMMSGSMKAADVLRDPRLAVHSPTVDPPTDDPSAWPGEAKLDGRGVEVPTKADEEGHRFRVDIHRVVLTYVGDPADHLVIETWEPGAGHRRRQRR